MRTRRAIFWATLSIVSAVLLVNVADHARGYLFTILVLSLIALAGQGWRGGDDAKGDAP